MTYENMGPAIVHQIGTPMSMQSYLDFPAVSSGLIQDVLDCPRRAWFNSWLNPDRVRETSAPMDAGTVAHAILLEGSADCCVVIDPANHPAATAPYNIPDGWTNKSIKAARDAVIASGKIPILKPAFAEIVAMCQAATTFIASLQETEPAIWAAFQPGGGWSESTITWTDGQTPCKMRPDRISQDRRLIINYKTTAASAEPDRFGRTQFLDYIIGGAFYRRGIEAQWEISPNYVFLVQETAPPYLCSLVGMDPHAFDIGGQKVSLGLDEWARCVKANDWPAYPRVVCYPELPQWIEAQLTERQMENPWG